MNSQEKQDIKNRIEALYATLLRNSNNLDLTVKILGSVEEGLLRIKLEYKDEDGSTLYGPTFEYNSARRRCHIIDHGLMPMTHLRRSGSRSRSRINSLPLLQTRELSANRRAFYEGIIRRECNRVFHGRSGGATRRKRRTL